MTSASTTPPSKRRRRKRHTYDSLTALWGTALAVAIFVAGFGVSWTKFRTMYETDRHLFFSATMLAVLSVVLFIRYVISTKYELDLLADWLDESHAKRVQPKNYLVILVLAVFFGVLFAVPDHIVAFAGLMTLYDLVDMWGQWQVKRTIRPLLLHDRQKSHGADKGVIEALHQYYFGNPLFERTATIMFFNGAALVLAVVAHYEHNAIYRDLATAVVVLNVTIGEIIIYKWRLARDLRIDELEGERVAES